MHSFGQSGLTVEQEQFRLGMLIRIIDFARHAMKTAIKEPQGKRIVDNMLLTLQTQVKEQHKANILKYLAEEEIQVEDVEGFMDFLAQKAEAFLAQLEQRNMSEEERDALFDPMGM